MILIRQVFQAKFGRAGELAREFTASMGRASEMRGGGGGFRVLTDLSGQFDTVVMEIEVESLAEWERTRAEFFSTPEFQESFNRTAGLIESGRAEFYTIES
jgi:hypothetical protein